MVIIIAGALITVGCSSNSNTNKGDASLLELKNVGHISTAESLTHDWGNINIRGGKVSHTFKFKNDDFQNLVLKGASTSCMCTVAAVALPDGSQSPTFGMHNNPTDWAYAVKPGEDFSVKVVFDPMAHGPDATGPIQRSVFLVTSSKADGEIAQTSPKGTVTEIKVKGDVLSKADYDTKYNN